MSVIVKGMEMPECCQECEGLLVGEWNEYDEMCDACHYVLSEHPWEPKYKEIDDIDTSKSRPDWCPLLPLPEKHGRLIDADALYDSLGVSDEDICFKYMIEECPTIVEAEGDGYGP